MIPSINGFKFKARLKYETKLYIRRYGNKNRLLGTIGQVFKTFQCNGYLGGGGGRNCS